MRKTKLIESLSYPVLVSHLRLGVDERGLSASDVLFLCLYQIIDAFNIPSFLDSFCLLSFFFQTADIYFLYFSYHDYLREVCIPPNSSSLGFRA